MVGKEAGGKVVQEIGGRVRKRVRERGEGEKEKGM